MKELVTEHQAHLIMLAFLAAAPIIGLFWGAITKKIRLGLLVGVCVGVGNYALWTVYNAITDHFGLDTVKNLQINLVFFIVVGIIVGLVAGKAVAQKRARTNSGGDNRGDMAGDRTR